MEYNYKKNTNNIIAVVEKSLLSLTNDYFKGQLVEIQQICCVGVSADGIS